MEDAETSMLLRRKETAAVEMTALAARGGAAGKEDRHAANARLQDRRAGQRAAHAKSFRF